MGILEKIYEVLSEHYTPPDPLRCASQVCINVCNLSADMWTDYGETLLSQHSDYYSSSSLEQHQVPQVQHSHIAEFSIIPDALATVLMRAKLQAAVRPCPS